MSEAPQEQRREQPQNIATAITEVSERATLLVREEIELAKAEVSEKITKLGRGAVVAGVAGIFLVTALSFVLNGFAWLLYYELPIGGDLHLLLGLLRDGCDPRRAGGAGWPACRAPRASQLPAGAQHGDRGGPQDPRDRQCRHSFRHEHRVRWDGTGSTGNGSTAGAATGAGLGGGNWMAQRSPAEIRDSIESNRRELAVSLETLHGEVTRITDWRGHVQRHQRELIMGAAAVGVVMLMRGRRRRKRRR